MRVALPAAVLARSKPYRRSLLKDQGHPTQSRGPHARGPGRSAGSCALIGYRTRRTGLLRTLRLQYTGSIVMTNAVGPHIFDAKPGTSRRLNRVATQAG